MLVEFYLKFDGLEDIRGEMGFELSDRGVQLSDKGLDFMFLYYDMGQLGYGKLFCGFVGD